jgi:N-dimethylarginine dimethylaminohydrolase
MTSHVLMCEPVHFRIAYEINPWMKRSNAVDGPRALEQWRGLYRRLVELGVRVDLVEQRPDVPDMTFAANAGVVAGKRFLPANFRYRERQLEEPYFADWFIERGYRIEPIHEPHFWEGEGDVLPMPGEPSLVFSGHRFRTEEGALDHLEELLGLKTLHLELVDPRYYHLDTCLCPLGNGRALVVAEAFAPDSLRALASTLDEVIEVPPEEAARFACNALVVEGDRVVVNAGCSATERALLERGYTPVSSPTDEFLKSGGSVKCLVLQLDAFV